MPRKHYEWKLRDKTLQLGERTLVMGILNVTPDSFSDGGKYSDPDRAFARAMELEEEGADIIDIGAESMRPGSVRVSEAEELRRLVPVLKRLQGRLTVPLSVDTYKSGVASKALELGADIINDPTGLTADPELARAVIQANAGLILNHMRGTPETWAKLPPLKDPMANLAMELDSAMHRAVREGLERKRIVIDPGLGFGKRKEQNSEILGRLDELAILDLPIMVGPSRKHFLAREAALETEFASAAAVAAAVLYGAHIVRVHDVRTMKAVVEVADEIARARAAQEAVRQEAAKAEGSRQGGRSDARETRPAGGPREARPPGSRPQEGNYSRPVAAGPQSSRFEERRDRRSTNAFGDSGPGESRKPLRPPAAKPPVFRSTASRPAVSDREPTAAPSTSLGITSPEMTRPSEMSLEGHKDSGPDAAIEARPMESESHEARPPISAPPSKPFYARPAASKAKTSRFDDRRDTRPTSKAPDSRSRDSRYDDRRDARGGPRQGSFGRPAAPRSDRPSGPRSDRPSGPPRSGRPSSGPPRSDRPSGPYSDRPSGPRSDRPSGPRSDRPSGPPRSGRPSLGPPRSGRPSSGPRSDRPAGPRWRPLSPAPPSAVSTRRRAWHPTDNLLPIW